MQCEMEFNNDDVVNGSFVKPIERSNQSIKSAEEIPSLTKKLSFTERLAMYDMDTDFTADIPDEYLSQSQSQNPMQSQESIDLSDDEINYSMQKCATNAIHDENDCDTDDDIIWANDVEDNLIWANDINMEDECYNPPNPMEFNFRGDSENSNLETEADLVNQSVCNIFEKTFEHNWSPVVEVSKRTSIGAKTLKKVNSETALRSKYDNPTPSTSSKLTPIKQNAFHYESPAKMNNSPFSQPALETRMDLSNDEYHIHVGSVTPKPDYGKMDTIALRTELQKYGLKPSLSKTHAIICLENIYNRTHPFMENTNNCGNSQKQEKQTKDTNAATHDVDEPVNEPQINFNVGFTACNLVDDKFKSRSQEKIFLPSNLRAKVEFLDQIQFRCTFSVPISFFICNMFLCFHFNRNHGASNHFILHGII